MLTINPKIAFERCKKEIFSKNKCKFSSFVNASQFDVNAQKSERIYSKIFTSFKPEGVGNFTASRQVLPDIPFPTNPIGITDLW